MILLLDQTELEPETITLFRLAVVLEPIMAEPVFVSAAPLMILRRVKEPFVPTTNLPMIFVTTPSRVFVDPSRTS